MWKWLSSFFKHPAVQVLQRLAQERDDYQLFVALRGDSPRLWRRVIQLEGSEVEIEDDLRVALAEVDAVLAAYPNGQPVVNTAEFIPLPKGVEAGLEYSEKVIEETLNLADLEASAQRVQVVFGKSVSQPDSEGHFSTTLTNISSENIRVARFGGFVQSGDVWKLNNVTGNYYSAEEFRAWYGMGDAEWIAPGESVVDGNNFGGFPVIWAYFCESVGEESFVAGALFKG